MTETPIYIAQVWRDGACVKEAPAVSREADGVTFLTMVGMESLLPGDVVRYFPKPTENEQAAIDRLRAAI